MRYPVVAAGAAICAAVLAACGSGVSRPPAKAGASSSASETLRRANRRPGAAHRGCVRSPTTFSPGSAPASGARLTVKVGAVVYVELVEAEKYLSGPGGKRPPPLLFPWGPARSSDPRVLRSVALCRRSGASTLPVAVYAFRARAPGVAVLSAAIVPDWARYERLGGHGPRPYRASVTVAR